MAPENVKGKKRKGATDVSPKPKKQKKSDEAVAAPVEAPKAKASRKRSEDMWDADVSESKIATEKPKKKAKIDVEAAEKPKKAPKKAKKEAEPVVEEVEEIPAEDKKEKKSKKSKAKAAPKEPSPEPVAEEEEDVDFDAEEEEDDQTAALLAGFESEGDESDAEKDDEGLDGKNFQDKVPKGMMKKLKGVSDDKQKPGVVFVGRIPHGFYESQMKQYFSQFGRVNRLRVSRNKKTGAPKHYAFVEFSSAEVAEIVAKTMDKYLMFGHILQCRVIPDEQVHPDLFKGANMRFKTIPRNKIAGNEMARGVERAVWEKRVENEKKRRASKNKMLKEKLGYDFEAPALKAVEDVPKKGLENGSAPQAIEAATAEETEQPAAIESATPKKAKKARKSNADSVVEAAEAVEEPKAVEEKPKKEKKAKAAPAAEKKRPAADATGAKAKKTKKSKA